MKINPIITESFQNISMKGILYSLNSDEKKLYQKVKTKGKVLKKDLPEFTQRIANNLVTRGLLKRCKNPQRELYFVTKGRRTCAKNAQVDEVAPPDSDIEKWIKDNEVRFQEKYGKKYKKYLYGKAWNKFNGKPLTESIEYKGPIYDYSDEKDKEVTVWRNPNPTWIKNWLDHNDCLRFLYYSKTNTLYVWDAYLAIHGSVIDTVGISFDIAGSLEDKAVLVWPYISETDDLEEAIEITKEKMGKLLKQIYGNNYEKLHWGENG